MRKSDWKVLLICVVIGVVTAVVTGWHLYQGRHEFVQAQVRIAFGNALQDYLQKWKDIDVFVSSPGGYKRLPNDSIGIKKEWRGADGERFVRTLRPARSVTHPRKEVAAKIRI